MTKNVYLAASAILFWVLSDAMDSIDGLGQISDLISIAAQVLCIVWAMHGVFLLVRRSAYRDFA